MTTTTRDAAAGPPVLAFAVRVHQDLDDLADAALWAMTPAELRATVLHLAHGSARIEELRLRLLAAGDAADIAAESGATSTAAWVAHQTRQVRSAAHADLKLAKKLDTSYPATRQALAGGLLNVAQAQVIVRAVDDLPASIGAQDRVRAEKHLIDLASQLDAAALKQAGRRVFEVLDPDAADEEEGKRLEAEEAAAARKTFFSMFDNGDGTHSGRFKIATLHAAMLKKALQALTSPRHQRHTSTGTDTHVPQDHESGPGGPGDTPAGRACRDHSHDAEPSKSSETGPDSGGDPPAGRACRDHSRDDTEPSKSSETGPDSEADLPAGRACRDHSHDAEPDQPDQDIRDTEVKLSRPEVMGEAFGRLLERFPTDHLPHSGGLNASVVVLLDYQKLLTEIGTAQLDTGEPISATQARRLACQAGIIPVVYQHALNGPPVILDVGRQRRLHDTHQRIALLVRDRGCTTVGCDRPPAWTEAHHIIPWAAGGGTSVTDGRLLCSFHHHKAHSPHYHTETHPDGTVSFHRRT